MLRIASAGGTQIGHRLLVEVVGLAEDDLEEALRAAVAMQLLIADPDGLGYEFRHALVREAVHDDLLPGEQTRLHGPVRGRHRGTAGRTWTCCSPR